MKKKIILPAAALLAVGIGGLGVAQYASADDTTPSPSISAPADGQGANPQGVPHGDKGGRGGKHGDRGEHGDRGGERGGPRMGGMDTAALATKLGVDETKLKTALDAVRESLKPTEADKASGTKPDPATMCDKFAEALATNLGIDKAQVTTALDELKAAELASHKEEFKTVIDKAVTDGKLTQTEADAVLKAFDAGVLPMGGGHQR